MNATNNFDFLRLSAAMGVLVSHQFALAGRPEPGIGVHSLGGIGVLIFFVTSGYLVAGSWLRDPSAWRFIGRRVLRIWPGLIGVIAASVLLLGPAVSTLTPAEYFQSETTWQYFRSLTMSIRYELPGVFGGNPRPGAVNGSLWTLPIEIRWYLLLLVAGVAGLLRLPAAVVVLTAAFAAYVFFIHDAQHTAHRRYSLDFGAFFCAGVCLAVLRDRWRSWPVLVVGLLLALVLAVCGHGYAAAFIVLSPALILFGTRSTPGIRRAGRFGDLSYGVYLYAFPVQQTLVLLTDNRLPMWAGLCVSTAITLVLAALSWHLVEWPALAARRHLVAKRAAAGDAATALP